MNLTLTNKAQDILTNAMAALSEATIDQRKVFSSVSLVDDARSFIRVTDVLQGPSEADAGIVDSQPERRPGTVDIEDAIYCMRTEIIVRFVVDRKAGADEESVVRKSRRLIEVVRAAIMADLSRGGRANLINFGGQVINGTDVAGVPRLVPALENTAFRSLIIPVAFAWADFRLE